ncbi:MAG: hypothetical protein K2Y56_18740 [Methylobacterium sp.]|uniref:hypothetical protein n=1 Tax=Methylobacterium sp. TaxID=409 RepID=UPI0025F5F390|nr:hypothetical protein [Methylobacterium sp.]MBX9933530.1 hypothetical protein [Methylobacterium sp.]
MDFDANYIKQCMAPGIEPAAIEELINETSGYNELALKVVTKDGRKAVVVRQPTTNAAMVQAVTSYLSAGADVRFGLLLVPARLLPELKVSVAQAIEPCTNIRIGSLVYQRAREMVSASVRNPRDLPLETVRAYVAGTYNGAPISGLTPSVPVVVAKPPPREFERREIAGSGDREPRRVAEAYASSGRETADVSPKSPRGASAPPVPPTMFEVTSAPMTIDLSRFREAR